jgi:hypothetical protein
MLSYLPQNTYSAKIYAVVKQHSDTILISHEYTNKN